MAPARRWMARACLAAGMMASAAGLHGGEAMRESAPSGPRTTLDRNGRPSDPLLERLMNPSQLKPGRDDSGMANPLMAPKPGASALDPAMQKQWKREIERQRNWLLENATQMANPDKAAGTREPERPALGLRERIEREAPAASRYLKARDAARDEDMRRANQPGPLAGPSSVPGGGSPQESLLLHPETDARDERPLDTARITRFGGDAAGAISSRGFSDVPRTGALGADLMGAGTEDVARGVDTARKTAVEERNSAFESLLESQPSPSASPGGAAGTSPGASDPASLAVIGLETRRAPASRSRQFDSLLAGGDPMGAALAGGTARVRPAAEPPVSRGLGLPEVGKPSAGLPGQAAPVATPRPVERRFQPQPAILELPRINP